MPQLQFVTLDVFTTTRYLGNPLAFVRIASDQDISDSQMQTIAREFNLSETIFLYEGNETENGGTEWQVRIFMTQAELPFAGHPTIGAACYALGTMANGASKGQLNCKAGPIKIAFENGVATASVPHNYHRHTQHEFTKQNLYTMHPSLQKSSVDPKSIDVVSPVKGMNFICTQLPDLEALSLVDTFGPHPEAKLDDEWNVGFAGSLLYVITHPTSPGETVRVRTRMIDATMEDPATGSASCGLAALLAIRLGLGRTTKFEFTQGVEMGRKSDIGVLLTLNEALDAVEKMELSGSAVKVMEGVIEV